MLNLIPPPPCVQFFWAVMGELDDDKKRQFLKFTTGCGKCPIGGLGKLQFVIQKDGTDEARLPTSHTCFRYRVVY